MESKSKCKTRILKYLKNQYKKEKKNYQVKTKITKLSGNTLLAHDRHAQLETST